MVEADVETVRGLEHFGDAELAPLDVEVQRDLGAAWSDDVDDVLELGLRDHRAVQADAGHPLRVRREAPEVREGRPERDVQIEAFHGAPHLSRRPLDLLPPAGLCMVEAPGFGFGAASSACT